MRRFVLAMIIALAALEGSAGVVYTGDALPAAEGWTIVDYPAYESQALSLDSGVLKMSDPNMYAGSAAHYFKDVSVDPQASTVWAEFDVKAVYSHNFGSFFGLQRDPAQPYDAFFSIAENSIVTPTGSTSTPVGNTDAFHTYRLELEGSDYRIFFDGGLLTLGSVNGSGNQLGPVARVHFGLGSSAGTAEFFVDEIRAGSVSVPAPLGPAIVGIALLGLAGSRRGGRGRASA